MKHIALLALIIVLFGCQPDYEDVTFTGIKNIDIEKVTTSNVNITADAGFYNPNRQKLVLKNVDVDILLKGEVVGHISQDLDITVPAKSDFEVPLKVSFSPNKLSFYSGVFNYIIGKPIETEFKGEMKVTYFGIVQKIPVEYKTEVKL